MKTEALKWLVPLAVGCLVAISFSVRHLNTLKSAGLPNVKISR